MWHMSQTIRIQLYLLIVTIQSTQSKISASTSRNYAVPSGQTIRMKCIPSDILLDESNISGRRSFVWTDEEGKEIVNPRMTTLNTGELNIIHAHEADSGVYHCKFRPTKALEHDGDASKIFKHKLMVYELPGHKFATTVTYDVTRFSSENTITELRDLLKKICASQTCTPGPVATQNCQVNDVGKEKCEISMTYVAFETIPSVKCNEICIRHNMIDGLKKAQDVLESLLLAYSKYSKSRIKPDLQTLDTKHLITCKAGYHLIESNYEHCFPCQPGTYSEAETLKCEYCPIGFYQEKFGSRDCEQCRNDLTTQSVGSKSRDECRPIIGTGIFKGIREGFAALFKG